jgi:hypothetical protein
LFVNGLASKPLGQFFWFGIKIGGDGFLRFGLKTSSDGFFGLASDLVVTVSLSLTSKPVVGFLVESQN